MKESPPWNIFLASPAQRQEACCYINSLDLGGNILSPHSARYPGAVKGISADVPLRNDLKAFCKWEIPPALDETEGNNLITKEEKQGQTKCQITYRKLAAGKNRVQLKPLVLRASTGICMATHRSSGCAWHAAVYGAWAGGANDSSRGLLSENHYLW